MDDPNYHAQNHPFTNQSCQHFSESSTNRRSGIGNRTLWSRSTYDDLPGVTQAPLSDLTHRPQGGPVTHQSQRPSGRVNREPCQVHGPPALFTQGRTGTVFSGPENFNHPSLENLRSTESAPSVLCSRQPSEFSSPCMSEELLGEPLGGGLLSTMPLSTVSSGSSESSLLDSQDYDFVEPLASKYECPICIQVLNNPVQTECGHRFCKACLLRWLGNQSSCRACPVCNMKLSEEQVFPDNFAKREINLLKVWCPHRGDGCSSIMELTHVQKHLAECDFSIVVCPNGCSGSLQRQKLKQHLVEKCPRRPVKCALCNSDIIFSEIKNHVTKNCPNSKVQCQFCGEEIQRRKADLHETECPQAVIPCTFADFGCSQKIPRGQVSNHHCIAQQDHLELIATALHSVMKSQGFEPPYNRMAAQLTPVSPNTATTITTMHTTDALLVLARELMHCLPTMGAEGSSPLKGGLNPNELDSGTSAALEALLTSLANASIKSPTGQTENGNLGSNTNSKLPVATKLKYTSQESGSGIERVEDKTGVDATSEIKSLKDRLAKLEHNYAALQRNYDQHLSHCHSLSSRTIDPAEDPIARICNGVYVWRVTEYYKKKREAVRGEVTVLHSPGFYTSPFGYKLCIRLNLNGVDAALGTHVSLFVHFMEGDFDCSLVWPFKGLIVLSILDQRDNTAYQQHISENLEAKSQLLAFHRPTSHRNHKGFGYMEFAPISLIEQTEFIKNDTLLIKAKVTEYT